MSGPGPQGGPDDLARAADELAAVAQQGQADVEKPPGGDDTGAPAPQDGGAPLREVDPEDVAPGPDVERPTG